MVSTTTQVIDRQPVAPPNVGHQAPLPTVRYLENARYHGSGLYGAARGDRMRNESQRELAPHSSDRRAGDWIAAQRATDLIAARSGPWPGAGHPSAGRRWLRRLA